MIKWHPLFNDILLYVKLISLLKGILSYERATKCYFLNTAIAKAFKERSENLMWYIYISFIYYNPWFLQCLFNFFLCPILDICNISSSAHYFHHFPKILHQFILYTLRNSWRNKEGLYTVQNNACYCSNSFIKLS